MEYGLFRLPAIVVSGTGQFQMIRSVGMEARNRSTGFAGQKKQCEKPETDEGGRVPFVRFGGGRRRLIHAAMLWLNGKKWQSDTETGVQKVQRLEPAGQNQRFSGKAGRGDLGE